MNESFRRRLTAVAALVLGLFLALALIPSTATGPLGSVLGRFLWWFLGIGAVGLPLLGLALALAGFERLPRFDMARVGGLAGGLILLVPYFIGVLTRTNSDALIGDLAEWGVAARLTGILAAFVATAAMKVIGFAGAVLVGFLALSALTLWTIGWHPLQRLERGAEPSDPDGSQPATPPQVGAVPTDVVVTAEPPPPLKPKKKKKKPARVDPAVLDKAALEDTALPPIELLEAPAEDDTTAGEAGLDALGQVLLETLRTFKLDGRIVGRTTGPVVTQFEVEPARGVKVGKIAALADDLALAMRAPSIRIVAPIPGRGAVGVEVPNPTAHMVTLRELMESSQWESARAALPIALGRDLEGRPVIADLAKMPHLLIAGATGSGKSVAINTMITSLVYRYSPKDLRLLMIDPKMVELSIYNALPHLRRKVVTNNHEAAGVLKWAVIEMNRRYELLHANNARNLADFNRKVEDGNPMKNPVPPKPTLSSVAVEEPDTPPPEVVDEEYSEGTLPYIVVIVDELADLMMTVPGEIETPLAMLAQKARAIGIHIILATQRPSVNVITGLIKANFASRIGFRVASKVDSRTILDQNGAEALLGNGDMLFLPPGKNEPMRIQGAYIGTDESERLTQWYVDRREARRAKALEDTREEQDILEVVRAHEGDDGGSSGPSGSEDRDELFRDAAEACLQNQGGSTSLLQRKLRIGYGRAARIIDQLYEVGILGPPDGSKPREVLIGFDQIDEYCR
jgi:S-DNA-T family DNA segregation ATPase FtsK/SpoIIIE